MQITAASIPDYDGWGPDTYWSCSDWITWHKALVQEYGLENANTIAQEAWNKQDAFEHNYNWCKYNQEFVSYFKSVGLGADQSFASLAWEGIHNVADAGLNVTGGIKNVSVILKKLLPILLLVAAIIAIIYVSKKANVI
jgi:hypothetical protein